MHIKKFMVIMPILLVFMLSFSACAAEKPIPAAEFYQGKTITNEIGFSPGGGYDRWSRMIAPYMEKYTGCTCLVANMPGGGGLLALNHTFVATPDGLTIDMANPVMAGLAELTENPGVKYKMAEFTHLGRVTQDPFFILANPNSPFKTIDDLLTKTTPDRRFKVGCEAVGDSVSASSCVVGYAFDLSVKVVAGYPGTSEAQLAAIKGEVDGVGCSTTSAVKFTSAGDLVPLVCMSYERDPALPDVPTIFEAANIPKDKEWIVDVYITVTKGGRLFVAPPGVPEDRAKFLADALYKVLHDKDFLAEVAEKKGMVVSYLSPEETKALYTERLAGLLDKEKKAIFTNVLRERFVD